MYRLPLCVTDGDIVIIYAKSLYSELLLESRCLSKEQLTNEALVLLINTLKPQSTVAYLFIRKLPFFTHRCEQ